MFLRATEQNEDFDTQIGRLTGKAVGHIVQNTPRSTAAEPGLSRKSKSSAL